ncbi:MAG TPA: BrnT family toxin [Gammaproteobacteria bacterium]|nr:BrnT family toxin [Gammaproteobacteria bacterium]
MADITFQWDPRKSRANLAKHGISFEEAKTAFYDEAALLISDPEHSESEDRFLMIGTSSALRELVVSHCHRQNDGVIRIISARKATSQERRQYRAKSP